MSKIDLSAAKEILRIFEERDLPDWYGIRGIKFIWHNTQSDPEIEYKGKRCSCYVPEDTMWARYREEMEEKNVEPDVDKFGDYMRENADQVYELCELALFN